MALNEIGKRTRETVNQQTLATMSPQELLAPGLRALESVLREEKGPTREKGEKEAVDDVGTRHVPSSQVIEDLGPTQKSILKYFYFSAFDFMNI